MIQRIDWGMPVFCTAEFLKEPGHPLGSVISE